MKIVERLSHDLRRSFPNLGWFSRANLMYMRSFAEAWPEEAVVQQAVGQLPWGHNIVLLTKLKEPDLRLSYARAVVEFGWSRNVLVIHIEQKRIERQGQAITNFERVLPKHNSDLARESLKDPYRLDFLGLGNEAHEREIEASLVDHIADFLLELGAGFAYVGRQVHLEVGRDDFYIDLLFYHLNLRCYVVIELKAGDFEPAHLGQPGFYLTAVDAQIKHELDHPSIGLLLCKSKRQSMHFGTRADHLALLNTNWWRICQINFKPAFPALKRLSVSYRTTWTHQMKHRHVSWFRSSRGRSPRSRAFRAASITQSVWNDR